ncbi:hypothetical protein BT96DRAFT_786889, partial [Gymnopus androsaceus JB14]
LEAWKLEGRWGEKHTQAFLKLKELMVSEPLLRSPRWDGSHFIVTTDGCKEGFAGVLAQRFTTQLENGNVVEKIH